MIHPDTPLLGASGAYEQIGTVGWQGRALGASSRHLKATSVEGFATRANSDCVELVTTGGKRVVCSPDQKVAVLVKLARSWKSARSIKPGMLLICEDGGMVVADKVVAVRKEEIARPIYFVELQTKIGNAFFGGVLCRA